MVQQNILFYQLRASFRHIVMYSINIFFFLDSLQLRTVKQTLVLTIVFI